MKYRKKPVVIEAVQYVEHGKLVKGMCNSTSCFTSGNNKPHVHTIHDNQIVLLEVGDYVIPEPDGKHFYPCKPDIFAETYENVEQPVKCEHKNWHIEDKHPLGTGLCDDCDKLVPLSTLFENMRKRLQALIDKNE